MVVGRSPVAVINFFQTLFLKLSDTFVDFEFPYHKYFIRVSQQFVKQPLLLHNVLNDALGEKYSEQINIALKDIGRKIC